MIISLITVKNLTLAYGDKDIVDGLSFSLTAGDFLVVIGDNGVGKTTLVRALLGQLKPKKGTIAMQEKLKIGYVPQFRNLDEEYPLSIKDFVALNAGKSLRPWLNKKERQHLKQILELTDLIRIQERQLGQASGGEKQRAYLAQALLGSPRLLILDESTASLDNEMKYVLVDLVAKLQKQGLSVIFITHDWELAQKYGTRYLKMMPGHYQTGPIAEFRQGVKNV